MAYLTILVDDAEPREFGMRDLEDGTSLNAGLREFLEKCAGRRRTQVEAKRKIVAASRESVSGSGREGHG
jgi:hypothetical protein